MRQMNACRRSYIVARGFRPDRVFGGQGDTAHGDDQQDAHLEITQSADVVTRPPKPGSKQRLLFSPRVIQCRQVCVHACVTIPTHGLVVDRMNMELKGGMGLGPPSPPFSSSSSSLSSLAGRGSVLAFLLTGLKRERKMGKN